MDKDSQETIILINQGDKGDGFFRFYSSHKPHIRRFWRIVPRSEVTITQETEDVLQAKVPMKYIGKGLNIKKPVVRREWTETERRNASLRFKTIVREGILKKNFAN